MILILKKQIDSTMYANKNGYQAMLKSTYNTFWFFENTVSKENLTRVVTDFSDYVLV